MRLESTDGRRFELRVVGYQFPDQHEAAYDSNWLNVQVDVTHPQGSWSKTDACLLTYELADLAHWLDAVGHGTAARGEIGFVEPNLRFRLVQTKEGATLRILFELELRPRWAPSEGAYMDDFWLDLPLIELDLSAAVGSLREQLTRFPQRASR